jgi:heat shock protein HtpX
MNYWRTGLLLAALTALFGVVGFVLGGQIGMLLALGMAAAINLYSYWNSDRLALAAHGGATGAARWNADAARLSD